MRIAALLLPVAAAMTCPDSSAPVHCGMEITSTAAASCDDVKAEIMARVNGQYSKWHDPHNNGTYTAESYGGTVSFKRVTGNGKYTDKMIFTLSGSGSTCKIEGCSASQVFSISDFGTNYCNLKDLYCGSADGCKTVAHDFTTSGESTKKKTGAEGTGLGNCLKV
eukprot:TRINITY_DN273_c0_g1_i1.p1 TRINITY_DN273_c0_g1~~TRINITY_DN273_c0_g1_i1.p1  ORF type:complete len:165 (+),score=72.25 TRINITY_DN273_c0_g1_i1:1-495(+)